MSEWAHRNLLPSARNVRFQARAMFASTADLGGAKLPFLDHR